MKISVPLRRLSRATALFAASGFAASGQQTSVTTWKEYSYLEDRFAMTFPYKPNPHPDLVHSGMIVYSVRLNRNSGIAIRTKSADNCDVEMKQALQTTVAANPDLPPYKEISIAGHQAYEGEFKAVDHWSYTRLWCGDKVAFAASMSWPLNEPKPTSAALRILNSFRIIDQHGH